jgi:hypothetical protein
MEMRFAMMVAVAAASLACPAQAEEPATPVSKFVRSIADATADGAPPSGDWAVGISTQGEEPTVTAIMLLPRDGMAAPRLDAETDGLIRSRKNNSAGKSRPDEQDLEFARTVARAVYIVGSWRDPGVIWEISFEGNAARWRTVGRKGELGDWQNLAQ